MTFGHHLLAYVEMLGRDRGALRRCAAARSTNARWAPPRSPAPRSRSTATLTATALGFDRPAANSLDAVSDRDFALEFLAAAAIAAMHLSRFAEEIVIWTSEPFRFVALSDAFTTGSSIMPQKRNPDAAELVRAKAGAPHRHARRAAGGDEGPAARLCQGHAGGQGAGVRGRRHARAVPRRRSTGMVRDMKADAAAMRARRRERLQHRDRSRRLAGARARHAVPRGASRHRRAGQARRGAALRARRAAARGDAARRSAHHRRRSSTC